MGIKETLAYIHNVKWQGLKPGLERTRALLAALGNPEKDLKFVHIAGTNGKGSTAACIAAVLQQAGYRTGLYTSPYIIRFNERMQVNGEQISDEELECLTDEIRPFADAMDESPTEFELITALAMKHFKNKDCDIVVLEVGMGGALDSTNVIDTPEVAVIASIGYDHVQELGPTIVDIAGAKAGIIKNDSDVVVYRGLPEVEEVFEQVAAKHNAKLRKVDFSRISKQEFTLDGIKLKIEPYSETLLQLNGVYQPKNATLAVSALEILREKGYTIADDDIVKGLAKASWPGRFEVLGRNPTFILDGAHNPQGVEATAESLKANFAEQKIIFVVGVMADKDVDSMIKYIAPLAKVFIAVRPNYPRAMDAALLAEKLSHYAVPAQAAGSVEDGVAEALHMAGDDGVVCALGSLYFSADIRNAYISTSSSK
ncbi:MAG: bifunctional folylpolyglutamate synthase/dihydrofolate synthase [Oscillospiraceae bacterium]|nr:bifunctional folylpolyglutamate synthase/dihydrofolate synthase [Oscillospiraceae bacterium]